jgi:hypothetical protein
MLSVVFIAARLAVFWQAYKVLSRSSYVLGMVHIRRLILSLEAQHG